MMKGCAGNLKRHVKVLSKDIGSRSILQPDRLEAASLYVESEFESAGLIVLRQEFEACGVRTANLVARTADWRGDGPVLVLGAHYDTVEGTPGADDNASAVAVLLETARKTAVEAPGRSGNLLFAAFTTEEPPCFGTDQMGSRIFAQRMKASELDLRGALVLEMVGYFSDAPGSQRVPEGLESLGLPEVGDFIALVGDRQSSGLAAWAGAGFEAAGSGLKFLVFIEPGGMSSVGGLIRLSDNVSFWDAGVPALMVTDTAFLRNPNYHSRGDRHGTLDYGSMERLVGSLAYTLTLDLP